MRRREKNTGDAGAEEKAKTGDHFKIGPKAENVAKGVGDAVAMDIKNNEQCLMIGYDLSGKIVSFNKRAQEFFGYREKDILGRDISILIPKERRHKKSRSLPARLHADIKSDPADEGAHINENILRSGRRAWVSWRTDSMRLDSGKTIFVATGRDVSYQEKAQESLADLERIIDSIDDGIGIADQEGTLTFVNERAAKMLGYRPEELVGRKIIEGIYEEDRKVFFEAVKIRKKGLISRYELRMVHHNGSIIEVSLLGTPRFDRQGNYIGSYTVIKDITEKRKNEEMLRSSETKFRSIFETSRDAIFLVDAENSTFIEANEAACRLYGYTKEEFKKLKISQVSAEPQRTIKAVEDKEQDVPLRFHKKKDGTVFPVEISGGYFVLGGRQFHTAFIRDISQRRASEERLGRLNQTLRALGNVNRALLRASDERSLLQNVCRIIAEDCGRPMVWIGYARNDEQKSVEAMAQVGMGDDYLDSINISWGDNERSRSPMGTSIREGKMRICKDIQQDPDFAPWKKIAARYDYRSAVAFPVCDEKGKTFGAIGIYAQAVNAFCDDEISLLNDLADNLSYGIISLRLREERQKNENKLRQAIEYLDNLLQFANSPIIVWGPDLTVARFNAAAERLTGMSAAEALGKDIGPFFFCCNEQGKDKNSLKIGSRGQRWKTIETKFCRADKSVRSVVWNLANIFSPDDMDDVVATIAMGQDITDRKVAENQIKNYVAEISKEKGRIESLMIRIADEKKILDGIIENTEALIAYLDGRFNFVKVNTAYCKEYECSPKDLIGKNYFSFFSESDKQAKYILKKLRREGRAVKSLAMPYYNDRHPERGITYRDLIASPIKDSKGEVSGIVLLYLDATQRVRDEKTLALHSKRLQEMVNDLRKLQMAVENASDIIFTADPQGMITSINNAVFNTLGWRAQELVGRPATILGGVSGHQAHAELWETIRKHKKIFSSEVINAKKNGQSAEFELHVSPVTDSKGEIVSYIGIERDQTEARVVDRAKKEFISLASHQLRTPLATISLSAQMMINGAIGNVDDEARRQIEEIFKTTHQMASLIDLFLNASRIELGRLEIDPHPIGVTDFIRDILRPIEPLAAAKNIALKSDIAPGISALNIDRKVMNIVLENLLTNALKYTPTGGAVALSVKKEGTDVIFAVSDTGVGVPKKQLHLLFNKTFRASNVGVATGYGLGLSMAKNVVEQSGGRIWAQSKQNRGSTFSVSIPVSGMKRKEISFES